MPMPPRGQALFGPAVALERAAAAVNAPAPASAASSEHGARASGSTRLAAEPHREARDERDPQRLPPSMLERFSTTEHPTGSTP